MTCPTELSDQVLVQVAFDPSGVAAEKVQSVSLLMNDIMRVPLQVHRDQATGAVKEVQFTIQRELLPKSSLLLEQAVDGVAKQLYRVMLKEFIRNP